MNIAIANTSIAVISLVVAIFSLVLAAASLTWQAVMFLLSGSRVKVALKLGAIGRGSLVTNDPRAHRPDIYTAQGFEDEVIVVAARNVGRMAVTVTSIALVFEDGAEVGQTNYPPDRKLPFRLEPQSEQLWWVEMAVAQSIVRALLSKPSLGGASRPFNTKLSDRLFPRPPARGAMKARMAVSLGSGKRVSTKGHVLVLPLEENN